jgi:hypothetical protein
MVAGCGRRNFQKVALSFGGRGDASESPSCPTRHSDGLSEPQKFDDGKEIGAGRKSRVRDLSEHFCLIRNHWTALRHIEKQRIVRPGIASKALAENLIA